MVRTNRRSNKGPNRSVVDYDTDDKLRRALVSYPECVKEESEGSDDDHSKDDWTLPSIEPETTEAQSMEEEIKRLQVLDSYLILDSEREVEFERITRITARTFDVPICLVSLVDIGRQWFMSNRGLPSDVRETPRKFAFCAHAIQCKFSPVEQERRQLDQHHREQPLHPMLIVPDATKDPRFCKNPLVTGPPDIRFYAGAPLITPEGYKIGTLCIIDKRVRPDGLSDDERETLQDIAAMVVNVMVNRRMKLEAEKMLQTPEQIIACTAHDLMTPLTGIQLSLSLLCADDELKQIIGTNRAELLHTAASCTDLLRRICQQSIDGLREKSNGNGVRNYNGLTSNTIKASKHTVMKDLVRSLHMIMDPIQKAVPIIITCDKEVPATIEADDLKLFRSALNLLSNAASRCSTGSIHLRIFMKHQEQPNLVFECEDTGTDIDVSQYPYLFQENQADHELEDMDSQKLALTSVVTLISSMKGDYGFRPRNVDCNGQPAFNSKGRRQQGSIFWFSVPFVASMEGRVHPVVTSCQSNTPAIDATDQVMSTTVASLDCKASAREGLLDLESNSNVLRRYLYSKESNSGSIEDGKETEILDTVIKRNLSFGNTRQRTPLRVESLEQAKSISSSCLGAIFVPEIRPTNSASDNTNVIWTQSTNSCSDSKHQTSASKASSNDNNISLESNDSMNALESFPMHPIGLVFSNQSTNNRNSGMQNLQKYLKHTEQQQKTNGISSSNESRNSNHPITVQQLTLNRSEPEPGASLQLVSACDSSNQKSGLLSSVKTEAAQRTRRALVIDDSIVIRKSVSRALNKLGFADVTMAEDGLEGLQELKKNIYDLVFCDFLMPKMDGMDCVRQYREWERDNRPWFRQLIVGMSAHANINDGGQGIQVGMDDFKPKPITIQTLTEVQNSDLCKAKSEQIDELEMKNIKNEIFGDHAAELVGFAGYDDVMCQEVNGDTRRQCQEHACLIATDMSCADMNVLTSSLEGMGWNAVVVQEGVDALRMLQQRNWDAVLIDNDLSETKGGQSCIQAFREWEEKNRVNGQKNIFMLCEGDIPSPLEGSSTLVQPPSGFNGVLRKPVPWIDLQFVLQKSNRGSDMNIICR